MKVVITGGCGFIGHHLIQYILKNTDWHIVIMDKLTYASKGLSRLKELEVMPSNTSRVQLFTIDLCQPIENCIIDEIGKVDYIIHLAAETHVDRSIENPRHCIKNNVDSTVNILEYAREVKTNLKRFLFFSTDEVYGPALPSAEGFKEWDRHNPTNPYAASKSAGESIALSYCNTYKLPIFICNTMNVFGERQHVEKFIPLCIKTILGAGVVEIHSYPDNKNPGSRCYIHATRVAAAIMFLLEKSEIGEKYNIAGEMEVNNLTLANCISKILKRPFHHKMVNFTETRPGHDLRYMLDGNKMREMGWDIINNKGSFEESIEKTVRWTCENMRWLQ